MMAGYGSYFNKYIQKEQTYMKKKREKDKRKKREERGTN